MTLDCVIHTHGCKLVPKHIVVLTANGRRVPFDVCHTTRVQVDKHVLGLRRFYHMFEKLDGSPLGDDDVEDVKLI